MTLLQLLHDGAHSAAALYAWTITLTTITALSAPEPDQRKNARQVLALLLLRRSRPE